MELEPVDGEGIGDAGGDGDPELVQVQGLANVVGGTADRRQQVGPPLGDPGVGRTDVEPGDGGVDALAPAEGDDLEQRERAHGNGRLLRTRSGGRGEQREHEQRAAHTASLRSAPRRVPTPRGGTCR